MPLTKTPRAIRVALLDAPLASGTVSPSIGMAWDVLALAEVWFSPAAVVSVFQLFTNCAHELFSSSSLLFKTPGFCREPFPRHFLLSPSQSKITCKIVVVSSVLLCPGGGEARSGHSLCSSCCLWSLYEPSPQQSPLSGVPNTSISQRRWTDVLTIQRAAHPLQSKQDCWQLLQTQVWWKVFFFFSLHLFKKTNYLLTKVFSF